MIAVFTSYDIAWRLILILYLKRKMPINSIETEMLVY